eukprot:1739073-Pyramimonas_sp.AAC.1
MPARGSMLTPALIQPVLHLTRGHALTSQSSFRVASQTLRATFRIFFSSRLIILRRAPPPAPPRRGSGRSISLP